MTPFPFRFVLILILTCHLASVKAQPRAVLDTLQTKNNVLAQLIQSESFEQAQVEAESYKAFLKRNNLLITPQAVRLMIVEGEPRWDRVLKNAHREFPQLFAFEVTRREAVHGTSTTKHRSISM